MTPFHLSRKKCRCSIKEGIELGKRPELVGGGLIRSLGGWEAIKKMRLDGEERIKGDQRILGDTEFVLEVLKEAEEKFECHYEMKRLGYDLKKVEDRVCEVFNVDKKDIFSKSRKKVQADARGLFCFWAATELGYSQIELAKKFGMTQPGVGYAITRGESISMSNHLKLKK